MTETRSGRIRFVEQKLAKNDATYWTFEMDDGNRYNTFDKKIGDEFKPGEYVSMIGEQKGQYWQMSGMSKVENGAVDGPVEQPSAAQFSGHGSAPKFPVGEYHLTPEEVKCRALEAANEWDNKNELREDEVMALADKFVAWIYGISE